MFQEIQQTKYCLSKVSSGMLEDKKKHVFELIWLSVRGIR